MALLNFSLESLLLFMLLCEKVAYVWLLVFLFCGGKEGGELEQESCYLYRGADKSLARPRRKQANVSVRMAFGI